MQLILRIVARGRRAEQKAAEAEVGVEIFQAGGPARVEAVVEAAAHRPAHADVAGTCILVARREVGARVARARPGDAAGHERSPRTHVVAGTTAQAREVLELLVGRAGAGRTVRQHVGEVAVVGKRHVELEPQHQARGEVLLVACVHAAVERAVRGGAAGRLNADRVGQGRRAVAEQVAHVTADIEAGPAWLLRQGWHGREQQRGQCPAQPHSTPALPTSICCMSETYLHVPLPGFRAGYRIWLFPVSPSGFA